MCIMLYVLLGNEYSITVAIATYSRFLFDRHFLLCWYYAYSVVADLEESV